MPWLEMSRTPDQRIPGWRVGECLYSPCEKSNGTKWGFWETMLNVCKGDLIFHLCGSLDPIFTGFSVAAGDGGQIDFGPDGPAELYQVPLQDHTLFDSPIRWKSLLVSKSDQLLNYFKTNYAKGLGAKERLFYVHQARRLQCLNGAYLSQLSTELVAILFDIQNRSSPATAKVVSEGVSAGTALRAVAARLGQQEFSQNVKNNFGFSCCFPGCEVTDRRFLIGSHIARWSDFEEARGRTDNGICLCVLHDRAFEVGAFTIDSYLRVQLHRCDRATPWVKAQLLPGNGQKIRKSQISPSIAFLKHHWNRHNFLSIPLVAQ